MWIVSDRAVAVLLLAGLTAGLLSAGPPGAQAGPSCAPTRADALGPFYKAGAPVRDKVGILLAGVSAADILSPIAPAVPAARPAIPAPAVAATAAERFAIVPAESRVAYHVGETLLNEGNRFNVAVGITNVVRGDIVIDRAAPQNSRVGTISVEISQFRSDSPRRDRAIRERWLESARFSIAEFAPTAVRGLPQTYAEGREVTLEITGNLKIRDVAKPTTFTTTLKLERTIVSGVATAKILMTDFGFTPPSSSGSCGRRTR